MTAQDNLQRFNAWFDRQWAGDPADPEPVPFTGDWLAYQYYESSRARAWAAWNAALAAPSSQAGL